MRTRLRRIASTVVAALALAAAKRAFAAADGIFPAEPAAQNAIHWENGYFVINGTPTFLTSGEIHYARVPRELWRDRILRAKAMGFNSIQTYVMWNAHEGKEGVFDFTDNLDLDAWLSLLQECGMYAVVRPGPYVCAEWENGGLPAWLCDKPGIKIRTEDAQYYKYVDRFESKVFQIIAKHQISKPNGNVLMVQLENELPNTWGTNSNAYTQHLYKLARDNGLDVPLFNSGLHHGDDPAGTRPFGPHEIPWYSTEFWTGWIGLTGDMNAQKSEQKIRGTWKIIASGGAGYDYYVVHGGTNFGYSKGAEVTASYDYAAPIGEAGQLRKAYFPMKRAAMFAQAFSDLLTGSKDGANLVASNSGNVQTYVRTGGNGSVIFLADAARFQGGGARGARAGVANAQPVRVQVKLADGRQIPSGDMTLRIDPGEIRPIVCRFPIPEHLPELENGAAGLGSHEVPFVEYAATGILTRKIIGNVQYIVCYGAPGEEGEFMVSNQPGPIKFKYPDRPTIQEIPVPQSATTLLVMNTDLADLTWIVGNSLVIGASYASADGKIDFDLTKGGAATVYSPEGKRLIASPDFKPISVLPRLTNWQVREGASEALAGIDTSKWPSSAEPKPMEQYDDYANGWGWYRTTIHRDAAAEVAMRFSGAGDDVRVFLNGQRVAGDKTGAALALKQGDNDLAVLCFNQGRPKMYNFTGATGLMAAKGLWGPVMLGDKTLASITTWRTQDATAADNAPAAPDVDDSAWRQIRAGGNTMNSRVGYAWFRATVDVPEGTQHALLLHQGIDDEGEFFLNGKSLGKHTGWNIGGSIDLSAALKPGKNVLAIRVKNNDGEGGISKPIDIVAVTGSQQNWKFHPGLDSLAETPLIAHVTNWKEWLAGNWMADPGHPRMPNMPTFYRTEFPWETAGSTNIVRTATLRTIGLKAGSVWLNGHNLGPYKGETQMYLPECWLEKSNTLVIFDAEGASPEGAKLEQLEMFARVSLKQ